MVIKQQTPDTAWHHTTVTRARREETNGHMAAILWFKGLSGVGKSTIAHAVEERRHRMGHRTVLDGHNVHHGLRGDRGISNADLRENIRRVAGADSTETYYRCPIEVCEERDVKGFYSRTRAGEVKDFTGIGSFYKASAQARTRNRHQPCPDRKEWPLLWQASSSAMALASSQPRGTRWKIEIDNTIKRQRAFKVLAPD